MASQKPILIAINSGGIAKLSDDTFWRIAPLQLAKAKGWTMGIEVMIQPTGNPRWTHKLRDVETGAALSVVPSQSPPYDLVIRPCTIHAGRYRWDIRQGGAPVQSSMDSFSSEQEAHRDGRREVERLTQVSRLNR